MTTTCAVIRNGVVVNMIVAHPIKDRIDGHTLVGSPPAHVGVGTKWLGSKFEDPPSTKPPPINGLEMV